MLATQDKDPIYAHLYNGVEANSNATGFICFNHFRATDDYPETIEVLESGLQRDEIGNWVRWIRQ